jgi:hypothetical protein
LVKEADMTRTIPEKGPYGKYHVDGRLDISSREEVKRMVSKAFPLLRAEGQCQ